MTSRKVLIGTTLASLVFFAAFVPYVSLAAPAALTATGGTTQAGETVTVSFTLENTGDGPSAYILDVGDLPDGFTIEDREDDGGTWKSPDNNWLWQTVEAGDSVKPSLTLNVPADASGEYTIEAEAKDSDAVVDSATATITVGAVASYSDLSVSPTSGVGPLEVTASATVENTGAEGSVDVPLKVDGEQVDSREVSLTSGESRTVEFTHTVESGEHSITIGDLSPQTVAVTAAPSASFTVSDKEPTVGRSVEFTSESSDSDGSIATAEWDVDGDGTYDVTGSSISHTFENTGEQTVTLRVTDDDGATDTASQTIDVQSNQAPTVSLTAPESAGIEEEISLSAEASDSDGSVESYTWDLDGDGQFGDATGQSAVVSYTDPETVDVSVQVTDDLGGTNTATETIEVVDSTDPSASFERTPTGNLEQGTTVELDASGSSDNVGVSSYEWTVTAPDGSEATLTGATNSLTVEQSGTYDVSLVVSDGAGNTDTASQSVTVLEPASFDSTLDSVPSTVKTTETFTVTATVTNSGQVSDEGSVGLFVDGRQVDSTTVQLDAGASEQVSFETSLERGDHEVRVGNADAQTVTANKPATFETAYEVSSEQVVTTETLTVTATVKNVGDLEGQTTVPFSVDGTQENTKTVTLAGGESTEVAFETSLSAGEHTVTVGDGEPTDVTALEPAEIDVSYDVSTTELLTTETLTVTASVENVGDVEGPAPVSLYVDGEQVGETRRPTLAGGESTELTFERSLERGDRQVTVNELEPTTVTVDRPAAFDVSYSAPSEVLTTETVTVTATVENVGDREGETTVPLVVDGEQVDQRSVALAGGESTELTFEPSLERGDHEVTVGDDDPTALTVNKPATFETTYEVSAEELLSSETLTVTATVENVGDLEGETTVSLTQGDTELASEPVTVAGESEETVTFEQTLSAGEYAIAVNGLEATAVTVRDPASVSTSATFDGSAVLAVVEPVTVTATVENTGDLEGEESLEVTVDDLGDDAESVVTQTETVTVAGDGVLGQTGSNTETVEFTQYFSTPGTYEVAVYGSSQDGPIATQEVTVGAATNPDASVSLTGPSGAVSTTEPTATYELSNVETGVSELRATLDGGETQTVTTDLTSGSGDISLSTLSGNALAEGDHTLTLELLDNRNNVIDAASTTFTVDTQAPTASVSASPSTGVSPKTPVSLDVDASDDNLESALLVVTSPDGETVFSGPVTGRVAGDDGATVTWPVTTSAGEAVPSGEYTVTLTATDVAGQQASDEATVVVDTASPDVSVDAVETPAAAEDGTAFVARGDTLTVSGTSSDGSGVPASVEVVLKSQSSGYRHTETVTPQTDSGDWSVEVPASDFAIGGQFDVSVTAVDDANNRGTASSPTTVSVDTDAPSLGAAILREDADTGRVVVTADESLASAPTVTVTTPSGEESVTVTEQRDSRYTGTFALGSTGTYTIEVSGSDAAGNTVTATSSTTFRTGITITSEESVTLGQKGSGTFVELRSETTVEDAFGAVTSSDSPLAQLSSDLRGLSFLEGDFADELNDNLASATIGIPVPDSLPVPEEDVTIRRYDPESGTWESVGETSVETIEGQQYWTVQVDHFSTYGAVVADTTAPTIDDSSLSPSGSYAYDTESVDVSVQYSDDATGIDTGAVEVYVDGTEVTDDAATQVTTDSASTTAAGLTGAGEVNVSFRVADEAGNVVWHHETFTVPDDTTAPSLSASVDSETTLADGSALSAGDALTEETTFAYGTDTVPLRVAYSDGTSGVDAASVSVTLDGTDVTSEATVGADAVTLDADVSAGDHTLVVTVEDDAGNEAKLTREFSVAADTSAPSVETTTQNPSGDPLDATTSQVSLELSLEDTQSDVDASEVVVEFDDGSGYTDVTGSSYVTTDTVQYVADGLDTGTYDLRVTLVDEAGNQKQVTRSFTIGPGDPPTVESVTLDPSPTDGTVPAGTSSVTVTLDVSDPQNDLDLAATSVSVDGSTVSGVTTGAGTVSYELTGLSNGDTRTVTVDLVDEEGNTETETVDVSVATESEASEPDSGGGGGGGGGGGSLSGGVAPGIVDTQIDEEGRFTATLNRDTVSSVQVDLESASGGSAEVTDLGSVPADYSPPAGESVLSVVEIEVPSTAADSQGTVTISIPASLVRDSEFSPGDLQIEHYDAETGSWEVLETSAEMDVAGGNIVLTATAPGFSMYAVTAGDTQQAEQTTTETSTETATTTETATETSTTTETSTATATETSTATETTEQNTPGFGVSLAVVALLAAALLARRRIE